MLQQVLSHGEACVTKLAHVRTHGRVRLLVSFQFVIRAKRFAARVAYARARQMFAQMNGRLVLLQLPRPQKAFATKRARVARVLRVRHLVTVQARRLTERHAAQIAHVRFLARVNAQVFGEIRRNGKTASAQLTIVAAHALVYRIVMNHEFVLRFERFAALVAHVRRFVAVRIRHVPLQRAIRVHHGRTLLTAELFHAVNVHASHFLEREVVRASHENHAHHETVPQKQMLYELAIGAHNGAAQRTIGRTHRMHRKHMMPQGVRFIRNCRAKLTLLKSSEKVRLEMKDGHVFVDVAVAQTTKETLLFDRLALVRVARVYALDVLVDAHFAEHKLVARHAHEHFVVVFPLKLAQSLLEKVSARRATRAHVIQIFFFVHVRFLTNKTQKRYARFSNQNVGDDCWCGGGLCDGITFTRRVSSSSSRRHERRRRVQQHVAAVVVRRVRFQVRLETFLLAKDRVAMKADDIVDTRRVRQ